jgi:hypothetical protein
MYKILEQRLNNELKTTEDLSVEDIWLIFKKQFTKLKDEKHSEITDLGIQSELYLGSDYGPPCFYFAFHYKIETKEENQTYSHYELLYCEFDLTNCGSLENLENTSIDLWLSEHDELTIFNKIDEWEIFKLFKDKTLKLNLYGTEV